MSNDTPASEPPTEEDLDRIERMIESHPEDAVVRVGDIRPLLLRLVAEVRRLMAQTRRGNSTFDS
jgi:hypothetical protein